MEQNEKNHGCNKHGKCPNCKCRSDKKLNVYDWLEDLSETDNYCEFIEVQFKNTRKGYYKNSTNVAVKKGDIVAVESSPGHDIGEVTLTGRLVLLQMKKANVRTDNPDIKRLYRKAKPNDLEKYEEAKSREHETMLKSRKIAEDLKLNMKIGDVEYQGDGNKAIFYYIADERVDFRQLIKVLADTFRVRIEMKQIGARQEAGRIGGIGPCGRELCCSGWMTSFVSVATSAARFQDISLNPQKLAGQCAKLKCCLNYEVDSYVEAQKKLPSREVSLETKDGTYFHFKTDIHKRQISYSTSKDFPANLITISASRAFEIIALNKRGVRVDSLIGEEKKAEVKKDFSDVVGQDSLTRFDKSKKPNNKKKSYRNRQDDRPERQDRSARPERGEKSERQERDDRPERGLRPQRNDRRDNRNNPSERRQNRPPRNNSTNKSTVDGSSNHNSEGSKAEGNKAPRKDRPFKRPNKSNNGPNTQGVKQGSDSDQQSKRINNQGVRPEKKSENTPSKGE